MQVEEKADEDDVEDSVSESGNNSKSDAEEESDHSNVGDDSNQNDDGGESKSNSDAEEEFDPNKSSVSGVIICDYDPTNFPTPIQYDSSELVKRENDRISAKNSFNENVRNS